MPLIQKPNLTDTDKSYQRLIDAHQGLTEQESHAFNARLILTLMNHIGNDEVWREALEVAANK